MAMKLSQTDEHLNEHAIINSQPQGRGKAERITSNKIIFIAAGLGALSWIIESSIHVFLLNEGNLIEEIVNPDLHHLLIRSAIFILFFLFGVYAQVTITERKRAEEAIQDALNESSQRQKEISALLEGANSTLQYREFKDAARAIYDSCKAITGATAGYVALLSKDGTDNELVFLDSGGLPCSVDPLLSMPTRGLRGEVYRTGRALYDNNFTDSEWKKYMPEGHVSLSNVLFAPLKVEGTVIGLLGLANKPEGFNDKDVRMAGAFGELAAVSLINSRTLQSLEDAEAEHKTILTTAMDGYWLIDAKGNFLDVNDAYCILTGYSRDELLKMTIRDVEEKEAEEETERHIQRVIEKGSDRFETIHRCKNGRLVNIEISANYMDFGGGRFFVFLRDITERKRAERELLARHEELAALYEVSSMISRTIELDRLFTDILNTITRLDIFMVERKGGIFVIEGENMKLVSHLGHDETFLTLHKNMKVGDCLCGLSAKTGEIIISGNCEKDSRHTVAYEGMKPHGHIILPIKNKNAVSGVLYLYLPADISIDDDKIKILKYIGTQIGIGIEKARLYEETRASSLHDPLTGLANRRLMDVVYEKSFALSKRLGMPFSVIMSDIDRFKHYNDTYGHTAGDKLLVDIAKIVTKEIRGMDLAVRYGGEEFLILLPETDLDGAYNLAERIRNAVENETDVTMSFGISSFKQGMKRKDLVRKADEALYQAKQSGRNRVVVSG